MTRNQMSRRSRMRNLLAPKRRRQANRRGWLMSRMPIVDEDQRRIAWADWREDLYGFTATDVGPSFSRSDPPQSFTPGWYVLTEGEKTEQKEEADAMVKEKITGPVRLLGREQIIIGKENPTEYDKLIFQRLYEGKWETIDKVKDIERDAYAFNHRPYALPDDEMSKAFSEQREEYNPDADKP